MGHARSECDWRDNKASTGALFLWKSRQHPRPSAPTIMKRAFFLLALAIHGTSVAAQTAPSAPLVARPPATWTVPANAYYPDAGNAWERRRPSQVGLDSAKVAAAVAFLCLPASSYITVF